MAPTVGSYVEIETAPHSMHHATYTQDTVVVEDVRQAGRVSTVHKVFNYISESKHAYTTCIPSVVPFVDITMHLYVHTHTRTYAHTHIRVLTCNVIYLSHRKKEKKPNQFTYKPTIIVKQIFTRRMYKNVQNMIYLLKRV